jgi:hypothetical protein
LNLLPCFVVHSCCRDLFKFPAPKKTKPSGTQGFIILG